ncbi:FecR family protein [Dinghuibacter silviterrae]|uniref:FecR family protein n=1 Tax=Dinghuibacter silviterrae TaxID=1539049 RepID=A0A4R8DM68_9BACT|nr:FecR domain-containing protein [Dinghuibacter silviterrae]TDW99033.1 FecR family protein [Dinghuibacter silviterrae]
MVSKEVDRQLLFKYLEGNCSRDQLVQIREYLRDEAYRDSLNQFMEEEWAVLGRQEFPALPGLEEKYARFRAAHAIPVDNKKTVLRITRRMVTIAAALVLGAVGVWQFPRFAGRQSHGAAVQWLSWHNEPGHRREILLPDSTRVYLGPAGTLRYGQNDDQSRLVQLEGEAYFVVRHDQRRPFTVITGALSTRDIGTEFNIRYYPGESSIAIAVASGKVQVLNTPAATPLAALAPGQLLQYDSLTRQSEITDLPNPSAIGAWRKGILFFRRQRLKEVTSELERYYRVRFQYSDPAKEEILITTLLDNKNLGDALDILALTAGVHFTREGTSIMVK